MQRFDVRLGGLARLLQAVRATDCHAGNFIAAGDWPVLIDAETLLHPRLDATPAEALLATEILPSRTSTSRGQEVVYAGFDAALPGGGGRPVLAGKPQLLAEHRTSFDRGAARMGKALCGRDELAAPDGPLKLTPGACTRVVLRPTDMYARLLEHRLSARSLASKDGGWPTVERLLRRYEDTTLTADAWDVVRAAEQAALQRADIPYFIADPRSGDLLDGTGDLLVRQAFSPTGPDGGSATR